MIHVMLPAQYASRPGARLSEPHTRLMTAVLQAAVDDCRGGSAYRHARGADLSPGTRTVRKAVAYVASTDRRWPFSFENLCDALGLDPAGLREELVMPQVAV